jgi:hypothetical protein
VGKGVDESQGEKDGRVEGDTGPDGLGRGDGDGIFSGGGGGPPKRARRGGRQGGVDSGGQGEVGHEGLGDEGQGRRQKAERREGDESGWLNLAHCFKQIFHFFIFATKFLRKIFLPNFCFLRVFRAFFLRGKMHMNRQKKEKKTRRKCVLRVRTCEPNKE